MDSHQHQGRSACPTRRNAGGNGRPGALGYDHGSRTLRGTRGAVCVRARIMRPVTAWAVHNFPQLAHERLIEMVRIVALLAAFWKFRPEAMTPGRCAR